jgi:type I restriction-modification system DNA methylase subunit
MKTSQIRKAQSRNLVSKLCSILDGPDYSAYSDGRVSCYLDYVQGEYKDELTLVDPVFFPKFAREILGFILGISLVPKEKTETSGERPDFLPKDLHLHPSIFETKGTDSRDLSIHFPQVQSYIQKTGARYGIVLNLREVIVISESAQPIAELSFSFEKLYRDFKANPHTVAIQPDTKRFVNFAQAFSCQELDFVQKVEQIAKGKAWTGEETLSLDRLTQKIREVVFILHNDVRSQRDQLIHLLGQDNERKMRIASEIDAISESIDPRKLKREISASSLREMLGAKSGSLDEKTLDAYFYRVAYFTMTRLLLVRLWEDIGFIDQSLYDGGFEKWYEEFNREIERVLRYAFHLAGERYSWLFNRENNYTWYYPSDKALVDVLYEFSHFNLGKLNADVLGTIYEEYVDRVDRKNKGQYYTPREVIAFIWDRVGFTHDNAFFRFEDGQRKPRLIFDPATGSGGFLVEAARRLRENAIYNHQNLNDLVDVERAIIEGLYGSEISAFSYYITEINLLIQLTPIIKNILEHKHLYRHPEFALSIIHQDSLKLHPRIEKTFEGFPDELKKADEVYERDKRHDIVDLEGRKREVYEFIKDCHDFDYVCANPPYIGEKGHKELFRATIEQYHYWREYYQGKMDYLYWFVILGLSKLKEGGKLGFITTSYWPTADGAAKLRKYILDNALIREVVDFGETKIFEGAPGQHNMIFVLERCSHGQKRAENRIKVARVKKELENRTVKERLNKLLEHLERHIGEESYSDAYIDVFLSPVKQGELNEGAWAIFVEEISERTINQTETAGIKLSEHWSVNQGVVPSPLRLTKSKYEELSQEAIRKHNLRVGDGVFVLTKEEVDKLRLADDEQHIMKPYFKNSDIEKYITSASANEFLIYTTSATKIDDYPNIKSHLEKFRSILEARLSRYNEDYRWFELHRSREQRIFEDKKIVCSYRAKEASFAYHEGSFYGSTDMYFIKPKNEADSHSLKYLVGILNSKVIGFWLLKKGKIKGIIKEQFATPIGNVPIRRINFDAPQEVKIHDHLVELVDSIIEAKRNLASYNRFFSRVRLTRLQDNDPLPEISDEEVVKSLGSSVLRAIRTHPQIQYEPKAIEHFFLKGAKFAEDAQSLAVASKDKQVLTLTAPQGILEYLQKILPDYQGKEWSEIIDQVLIPIEPGLIDKKRTEILSQVASLRDKIKSLQQEIDSIVFDLYGLTNEEIQVVGSVWKEQSKEAC